MTNTLQEFVLALVAAIVAFGISHLRRSNDDEPTLEDWCVGAIVGIVATFLPMVVVATGMLATLAACVAGAVRRA